MAVFALFCAGQSGADAARLTSDCTRDTAHTYFTTTYLNFMQYAGGLQHGTTRYAQLLNMLQGLPTDDQDPDDHVTFINTDIKAVFQEMCRQASIDTLTGKATQKKKCCLLVLNSVTSPPRWIRQPQLRAMHGVCVCFFSLFFWRPWTSAGCHAPVFSGTSAFSLCLTPSRLTPSATSAVLSPPRFHLCPSSPCEHVCFTSPLYPGFYYTHLM